MTQQQSKTPRRQTIEQERGQGAWSCIKDIKDLSKKEQQDYRSLARGLNPMIQINGLGQSLGFFYAKSRDEKTGRPDPKKAHYRILNHLTNWMIGHFTPSANTIDEGYGGLLFWVLNKDTSSSDYRRATTECLAFGRWLSRFAEAELSTGIVAIESTTEGTGNG
jgi:CRISPR-associated protein Cmr5